MAMPDVELMKTGETGGRDGRGRFARGYSGNPAGRPRGIPNPAARAAMLLDGHAETLTKKAFALPPVDSAADLAAALAAVAAEGTITADEALALSQTLAPLIGALAACEEEPPAAARRLLREIGRIGFAMRADQPARRADERRGWANIHCTAAMRASRRAPAEPGRSSA